MTAKDMKIKCFSLIEEYYPEHNKMAEDEDVLYKINGVINQIQMELMPLRKINASKEIEITLDDDREINILDYIDDMYQIDKIRLDTDYDMPNDTTIIVPDDYEGTIKVYYFKNPELMKLSFETDDEYNLYDNQYEFELEPILLEIMPWGIAAALLKMDMITNYGRYFEEKYNLLRSSVDTRRSSGRITITGGVDI